MAGGLRQVNYGRRITAVRQGVEDGSEAVTGKVDTAGGGNRRRAVKVAARAAAVRAAAAISGVVSAALAVSASAASVAHRRHWRY